MILRVSLGPLGSLSPLGYASSCGSQPWRLPAWRWNCALHNNNPCGFTHTNHCHSSKRKLPSCLANAHVKTPTTTKLSSPLEQMEISQRMNLPLRSPSVTVAILQKTTLLALRTKALGSINHLFASPRNMLSSSSSSLQLGY